MRDNAGLKCPRTQHVIEHQITGKEHRWHLRNGADMHPARTTCVKADERHAGKLQPSDFHVREWSCVLPLSAHGDYFSLSKGKMAFMCAMNKGYFFFFGNESISISSLRNHDKKKKPG